MKLILIAVLLIGAAVSNTEANVISDMFKNWGASLKNMFTKMGGDLKEVGKAMVGIAKDKAKSLLSQSVQAVVGAHLETFKKMNLTNVVGKREMTEQDNFLIDLISRAHELIEKTFSKSLTRIEEVIDDLVHNNAEEPEILERLNDMDAEHRLAVKSIIDEALNNAGQLNLDSSNKISNQAKKRELLSTLKQTLQNIRDAIAPHVDNILQITKDIASTLGHHAGKLLEQHRNAAWENVKNTFSTIKDKLTEKLQEVVAGY